MRVSQVTPADLTDRAIQQLRVMGLDSDLGFVRARAIQHSLNKFELSKIDLEREINKLSEEHAARAPYAGKNDQAAERVQNIARLLNAKQKELSLLKSQAAEGEKEISEIGTWHPPVNRLMDRILEELGVSTIRQALPGFDNGFGA